MGNQVRIQRAGAATSKRRPAEATTLPQLPRLVRHALSTPDRIEAARLDMARLARAQLDKRALALTVIGMLLAAVLALELWRLAGGG
ncbi:MAG: hypothetical protein R3E34_13390 [Rhodocyclaceae bacterium]